MSISHDLPVSLEFRSLAPAGIPELPAPPFRVPSRPTTRARIPTRPAQSRTDSPWIVRGFDKLAPIQIFAWKGILATTPGLGSPFFRPEYFQELNAVQQDVQVAVLDREDDAPAFLPFEEPRKGLARGAGGPIGCRQGLIGTEMQAHEFLQYPEIPGIRAGYFVPFRVPSTPGAVPSRGFRPLVENRYLDLRGGFEGYLEKRSANGHTNRNLLNSMRKLRKLERDHGEVRFESNCRDLDTLRRLLEWKREQMARTGARDPFVRCPWIADFLQNCLHRQTPEFRGDLSVLFLADRPVAAFYALRSGGEKHGLFFGYEPAFSAYSPGAILLTRLAQEAENDGVHRIDLGAGPEPYKQTFQSDTEEATSIAIGGRLPALLHSQHCRLKAAVRRTPLAVPLKRGVSRIQRMGDRFHPAEA